MIYFHNYSILTVFSTLPKSGNFRRQAPEGDQQVARWSKEFSVCTNVFLWPWGFRNNSSLPPSFFILSNIRWSKGLIMEFKGAIWWPGCPRSLRRHQNITPISTRSKRAQDAERKSHFTPYSSPYFTFFSTSYSPPILPLVFNHIFSPLIYPLPYLTSLFNLLFKLLYPLIWSLWFYPNILPLYCAPLFYPLILTLFYTLV